MNPIWPSGYARTDYAPNKAAKVSKVSELITRDDANCVAPFHVEISGTHSFGFNFLLDTIGVFTPGYANGRSMYVEAYVWSAQASGVLSLYLTDAQGTNSQTVQLSGTTTPTKVTFELPMTNDNIQDVRWDYALYGESGLPVQQIWIAASGNHMNCWFGD
jgi:hypothetical protein